MATAMSSTFATAQRRKRIATYGKSSRTAANFSWSDEAPSPERPRKVAGASNGALKRPAPALGGSTTANTRTSTVKSPVAQDDFEVPSDDDLGLPPSPAPARRPVAKQIAPVDEYGFPSDDDQVLAPRKQVDRLPQSLRKSEPARPQIPVTKTLRKPEPVDEASSDDQLAPPRRRAKTPHTLQKTNYVGHNQAQTAKRPAAKPKVTSRATTPASPALVPQKKNKGTTAPSKKPAVQIAPQVDVFDVPMSDEDIPLFTPRRNKPVSMPRSSTPALARMSNGHPSPITGDSDDSNASRKRKRQESSQSSLTSKEAGTASKKREISVPPRNRKYLKKEESTLPGHEVGDSQGPSKMGRPESKESAINKPKRTRIRAPPSSAMPSVTKGQSSPAKLHTMLAVRPLPQPSALAQVPEITALEDETMYDIQDIATPNVRSMKTTVPESVTPRQKQMLSNLLEDSSNATTPGMPSISRLQLTDRKPGGSLLANLARSSSDIPQSAYTRKTRLIDTLRQALSSSEEDEDSESDEESDEDNGDTPTRVEKVEVLDNMRADLEVHAEPQTLQPQTSQTAVQMNSGSRITYAKQRTYREDTNPEEALLLSMDIDEVLGLDRSGSHKKQDYLSDEEDEPDSQVRGIHELRRQGQNQKFQMEAQTTIDDIADKARLGNSVRRSAMLGFCTQMADEAFLEQLLQSALGHQFVRSIGSKGEIIFDFAASVAIAFILKTDPDPTMLGEIHRSSIIGSLTKLIQMDTDINRIAKERKTNLSKIGLEEVANFRSVVQESSIWPGNGPEKVSPQVVALTTLELLVLGLRKIGNLEGLLNETNVCKLLDLAASPCERLKDGKSTAQDLMVLQLVFSIMESESISRDRQATWSNQVLERLAGMMPIFFVATGNSPISLALRLCVILTNNKPKSCEIFAKPAFVKPLVGFISHRFAELVSELEEQQRTEVVDGLTLSLGAMINLAELSDQARASVAADGDELVDVLAKILLEGSERAAQADSLEASHASIPIGYLAVLLGNLCRNDLVRQKIRSRLPGQRLDLLVEAIKEFVRHNERVDRMTSDFDGEEGREMRQNWTTRMMQVVQRLEKAES